MPFPTIRRLAGRPATHPSEVPVQAAELASPRSQEQADKYFRRVTKENVPPSRLIRWLGVGGWVVGGGEFDAIPIPPVASSVPSCLLSLSFSSCRTVELDRVCSYIPCLLVLYIISDSNSMLFHDARPLSRLHIHGSLC
jgi:hypothetical protein